MKIDILDLRQIVSISQAAKLALDIGLNFYKEINISPAEDGLIANSLKNSEIKDSMLLLEKIIIPQLVTIISDTGLTLNDWLTKPDLSSYVTFAATGQLYLLEGVSEFKLTDGIDLDIVFREYAQFMFASVDRARSMVEVLFTNNPSNDEEFISSVIAISQRMSTDSFRNPSSCAGLPKHRQFSVLFWVSFFVILNAVNQKDATEKTANRFGNILQKLLLKLKAVFVTEG